MKTRIVKHKYRKAYSIIHEQADGSHESIGGIQKDYNGFWEVNISRNGKMSTVGKFLTFNEARSYAKSY